MFELNTTEAIAVFVGAALPFLSFLGQRYFSGKADNLTSFRRHYLVYYVDWLLVPFSALALLESDPRVFAALLPIGLLVSYYAHEVYRTDPQHHDAGEAGHFFTKDFARLSAAGWVHHLFTAAQLALIGALLLTAPSSLAATIAGGTLLGFAAASVVASRAMHGRIILMDVLVALLLATLTVAKLATEFAWSF